MHSHHPEALRRLFAQALLIPEAPLLVMLACFDALAFSLFPELLGLCQAHGLGGANVWLMSAIAGFAQTHTIIFLLPTVLAAVEFCRTAGRAR